MASGTSNGIEIWDPKNGKFIHSFKSHELYNSNDMTLFDNSTTLIIDSMTTLNHQILICASWKSPEIKFWNLERLST